MQAFPNLYRVVTLGLSIACMATGAQAQEGARRGDESASVTRPVRLTLPQNLLTTRSAAIRLTPARAQDIPNQRAERGLGRKILGAAAGAAGGFFAGAYLGAWIEGDRCDCDDPGLKGALIGAPIGATAGGILGFRYLF